MTTIKQGLDVHRWCIENNMPLDQQTFYNNNTTSVSIVPEIKTIAFSDNPDKYEMISIPPEYKEKIIAMHCRITYFENGEHYFEEYDDIEKFKEFIKEGEYIKSPEQLDAIKMQLFWYIDENNKKVYDLECIAEETEYAFKEATGMKVTITIQEDE
jgi:hypothetical protein